MKKQNILQRIRLHILLNWGKSPAPIEHGDFDAKKAFYLITLCNSQRLAGCCGRCPPASR